MSVFVHSDPVTVAHVRSFVMQERQKCHSLLEWRTRLAGYGYALKDTDGGTMITTLPHGVEVCILPGEAVELFH